MKNSANGLEYVDNQCYFVLRKNKQDYYEVKKYDDALLDKYNNMCCLKNGLGLIYTL